MTAEASAFRIGVTGSRTIAPSKDQLLRDRVGALLDVASAVARRFGFSLSIVSPLAEGADRLVAEEGLRRAFGLRVPLPFSAPEYERDFPSTVETFRHLLSRGRAIELGGSRGDETEGYERAGRYVVDHCDVLLALWDGLSTGLRGGTSATIEYAVGRSTPVCWLSLGDRQLRWLLRPYAPADWACQSPEDSVARIEAICDAKGRASVESARKPRDR